MNRYRLNRLWNRNHNTRIWNDKKEYEYKFPGSIASYILYQIDLIIELPDQYDQIEFYYRILY